MRRTRQGVLAVPLAAAVAALAAGCGGSSKSAVSTPPSTLPSSTATVTDTVSPPTTTATASTTVVTGPQPCASTSLTVTLGTIGSGAGSTYYPLHLTNKGSGACTLTGFPGVSFVAPGNGAQVGAPATRSGSGVSTITLATGATATSVVQVANYANYDPSTCRATAVSGFRVYVPDNTAASYVPIPGSVEACAGDVSSTGSAELLVQAVIAGSR